MKVATARALAKAEQDVEQKRGLLIGTASGEESSDLEVELAGDRYLAALVAREQLWEEAKLEPPTEEPPPPEEEDEPPPEEPPEEPPPGEGG